MVRPNHYSVEDIQNLFLEVCEENYGPLTRGNCFVAKDATVIDVETTILNGLSNQDIAKKKYLDMCLYLFQCDNDVMIKIIA